MLGLCSNNNTFQDFFAIFTQWTVFVLCFVMGRNMMSVVKSVIKQIQCSVFCNTTSYTIQKHEIFMSNQNDFTNNEFLFLLHKNVYIWMNFSAFNKIFWKCLVNIHREVLLFVSKIQTWFEKNTCTVASFWCSQICPTTYSYVVWNLI